MSVLSVVQEIWKQHFNRFDLVNLFNFRFQAKSETTRGETTFVFRNKPQSQKKVGRKQKEKAYFNSKVGLFEKRCLPNQWQWCFHLCNPVRVCPLMARWLRMDYFGMKAETIVACFPQALQNPFWFPAQTNQSKTWRKAFCCLHLGQWVSSFFSLISTSTFD